MEPEGEDVYDELRSMITKKAAKFDKIEEAEEQVELFQAPETSTQVVIAGDR
jgi:hypothetical protein